MDEYILRSAKRLIEIRESTGLNQKDFSEKYNINKTTYCRYESGGIMSLPLDFVDSIRAEYGIDPSWLLGFDGVQKYGYRSELMDIKKRIDKLLE